MQLGPGPTTSILIRDTDKRRCARLAAWGLAFLRSPPTQLGAKSRGRRQTWARCRAEVSGRGDRLWDEHDRRPQAALQRPRRYMAAAGNHGLTRQLRSLGCVCQDSRRSLSPHRCLWLQVSSKVHGTSDVKTCKNAGRLGGLSRLSVHLGLRSRSHSLWVRAPHRALCCQLGAWSLLRLVSPSLSDPPSLSLSKINIKKKKKKNELFRA